MLTDQTITTPPLIVLGYDLFYDPDLPMAIDIAQVQEFVRAVASSGRFTFYYLSFARDRTGDARKYYARLVDFKIPFKGALFLGKLNPAHWKSMSTLLRLADLVYAPEVTKHVNYTRPCTFSNVTGVMECLKDAAASPIPFSRQLFAELEEARSQ